MNAQRPDRVDVEAIWWDLHRPLLGFITRRVPDRDSAEDILQEVMLRIHHHTGELTRAPTVSGWTCTSATRPVLPKTG